jgi:hypothetical protein
VQSLSAHDIEIKVVVNFIYAALVWGLSRIRRQVARRDPRYWWVIPTVTAFVWLASNLLYSRFVQAFSSFFFYASTILSAGLILGGLRQFWTIGLVGADVEIKNGIDYSRALQMCSSSLEFLGIGAAKLTQTNKIFADAVDRCDSQTRPIRFLLSSPESVELTKIAQKAGRADSEYRETVLNSLRVLATLRDKRSKNIEVRFYKDFPAFRIMFIDDQICLTSHYVFGKGDGSQLPQLHIIRKSGSRDVNSLYYGFRSYFDRIWEESRSWDFKEYLKE